MLNSGLAVYLGVSLVIGVVIYGAVLPIANATVLGANTITLLQTVPIVMVGTGLMKMFFG